MFCTLSGPVWAACPAPSLTVPSPLALPPAPAPLSSLERPAVPECLQGLSSPSQENCSRDVVADYSAEIAAYGTKLQELVDASNAYANAVAERANSAVQLAENARTHADAVLNWAQCEISEINEQIE